MVDEQSESPFYDDTPKVDPATDRLGHARFASRLAQVITALAAPQGYVIGLHGPWGSGKSTVLNFIERSIGEIEGSSEEKPLVVRFEPWIISGHQDITSAFMKLLAEHLPKGKVTWIANGKRLVGNALRSSGDDVIDAIATVGVIADGTGGLATKVATSAGKKAIASAAGKWLEEPSLQSSYNTLVERLRNFDRRIVVMIDDIDRLTSDEIRALMTMVKTLGKLPNVIYLLSYDRSVVWGALKTIDPDPRAGAFAEKIVQQELELPTPSRSALLTMLSDALSFLELPSELSQRRVHLVRAGIALWVRQPRDVVRLANAMRFSWEALRGEIDPDDLLCMEGLRLHDRELFEWVRDSREELIEKTMPYDTEARKRTAQEFADKFAETRCKAVDLMVLLFPNRSDILRPDRFGWSGELWASVRARRGIATQAGYDAYFSLNPGVTTLPKALVDQAVSALENRDELEGALRIALEGRDEAGNSLIGEMLSELESRIEQGAPATLTLLSVLMWMAEEIDKAPSNGDFFTPQMQHYFLTTTILQRWSPEQRIENLHALYSSEPPLSAVAALHIDLARSIGALPGGSDYPRHFVTKDELEELGADLILRIEKARSEGTLNDQPAYHDIARIWALHGGKDKPRGWIADAARSNASNLAKVALGLLGYSISSDGRSYSMPERPDENLYDEEALLEACALFSDRSALSSDEAARINAIERGLLAYKSSSNPSDGQNATHG